MACVTLALGSNLGDRAANLRQAREALAGDFALQRSSHVYETEPAYVTDQPRFFNQVCQGTTELEPQAALRRLPQGQSDHAASRS